MTASTVAPTQVSTVREEIVLETTGRKATVTPIRSDLNWLAQDVFSTPHAVILRDDS